MKTEVIANNYTYDPDTGCWMWDSYTDSKGYGHVRWRGRTQRAPRVFYQIYIGHIPDGLHVLHKCDTPTCVNPEHLFLGTAGDNARDRSAKGRNGANGSPGERNARATLTWPQARAIRARYAAGGITQAQLCREYGVRRGLINHLVSGRTWKEENAPC